MPPVPQAARGSYRGELRTYAASACLAPSDGLQTAARYAPARAEAGARSAREIAAARARTARGPVEVGIDMDGCSFRVTAVNARSRTPTPWALAALVGPMPAEEARASLGEQGARALRGPPVVVAGPAKGAERAPAVAERAAARTRRRALRGRGVQRPARLDPNGRLRGRSMAPGSVETGMRVDWSPARVPCGRGREAGDRPPVRRGAAGRCPPRAAGARAGAGAQGAPVPARCRRWRPPRASRRSATGCWVERPLRPTTPAADAAPSATGCGRYSRSPFCHVHRANTSSS